MVDNIKSVYIIFILNDCMWGERDLKGTLKVRRLSLLSLFYLDQY